MRTMSGTTLLTFELTISGKDAETMTRTGFIAYRNQTRLAGACTVALAR